MSNLLAKVGGRRCGWQARVSPARGHPDGLKKAEGHINPEWYLPGAPLTCGRMGRRLTADEGTVITEETGADERFGQLTAMRNACHRLTRRTGRSACSRHVGNADPLIALNRQGGCGTFLVALRNQPSSGAARTLPFGTEDPA